MCTVRENFSVLDWELPIPLAPLGSPLLDTCFLHKLMLALSILPCPLLAIQPGPLENSERAGLGA